MGHSLGGLLAYILAGHGTSAPLADVVTIDAPLQGITGSGAVGLDLEAGCGFTQAARDMHSLYVGDMPELQQMFNLLKSNGTRVATVENIGDCAYYMELCHPLGGLFSSDLRGTQVGPADWAPAFNDSGPTMGTAHAAVLYDAAAMVQVAQFIEPQT